MLSRSREEAQMIKITLTISPINEYTPLRAVARPDRAAVIPTEKDADSARR